MRYQVVFSERGRSHTIWFDNLNSARRFAAALKEVSCFYEVSIFEQSESGAREISV